jgi:TPR repeat protein
MKKILLTTLVLASSLLADCKQPEDQKRFDEAVAKCNSNVYKECVNLGVMYVDRYFDFDSGCPIDSKKAAKAFQKACKGGIEDGCNMLTYLNNGGD